MNKQKLDEILKGLRDKHGLKSAVIIIEDDNSIATGIMVGSKRFAKELPELALEAVVRINKRAEKHEERMKKEMLAELLDVIPKRMLDDMPADLKEIMDDITTSKGNDKADKNKSAEDTVVDLMERMKKGKDH